jgi:hypothetical protein
MLFASFFALALASVGFGIYERSKFSAGAGRGSFPRWRTR